MNTTLGEVFERRAQEAGNPDLDPEQLVRLGEARLRHRRLTAIVGSAAAVVVAIAIALGGAALNGPDGHSRTPAHDPAHQPTHSPKQTMPEPVRRLVYSDGYTSDSIHLGNRAVETGDGSVHIDVTDDGVVYSKDGGAWFSDGGTPRRVGSHLCGASPNGEFSHSANRAVMSANAGYLVAWFDCGQRGPAVLVLFDTAAQEEVTHRPIPFCGNDSSLSNSCELFGLTQEHVYLNRGTYAGYPRPEFRLDVTTGRLSATTPRAYAEDVRRHARGLVVGDSPGTGVTTDGIGQSFRVVGTRLVPELYAGSDWHLARAAFDTATGRPLNLRLPARYHAGATNFTLFEWLDDDRVALAAGGGGEGGILTCRLSTGRCVLSVPAAPRDRDGWRVFPGLPLPG